MPEPVAPVDPEAALREALATGGPVALLGDADPAAAVRRAAGERRVEWVDSAGLTTQPFDRAVRGAWDGGDWQPGALTRAMQTGDIFLMSNVQSLPDDLRQRLGRMLLEGVVALTGPAVADDRVVRGRAETSYVLHVDDHQPMLLQVYTLLKRFAVRIRIDRDGPPPVARR